MSLKVIAAILLGLLSLVQPSEAHPQPNHQRLVQQDRQFRSRRQECEAQVLQDPSCNNSAIAKDNCVLR